VFAWESDLGEQEACCRVLAMTTVVGGSPGAVSV